MRAAYYEKNGPAREVLSLGEIDTPKPGPGEVRVRLKTSGVNPSDVKSREGRTRKIAFPRVIPHSDGAGEIDAVGDGVPQVARRRAGLDLERPVEARLRHLRRLHRAARRARREAARSRELRGRRLPRHSGDDRLSRGRGRGRGEDRAGVRRRRRRRPLRHPVRQGARRRPSSPRSARRPRPSSPRGRRRPHHRLQARERRRAGDGDHQQGRRRRGDRDGLLRQRQADAVDPASAQHGRGLWQRQRRGDDPGAILPDQRHHHPIHLRLRADAGRARRSGLRHQPHAGEQDADQQRGADAAAQGHRRRPRGGRTGQGDGQRGGFDDD